LDQAIDFCVPDIPLDRRKTGKESGAVRRGMHRHLFLIVDFSKAMEDTSEMKPSRISVTLRVAEAFIMEYFDQNPIAHLGIIVTRNSIAEKLTELGGKGKPVMVLWLRLIPANKGIQIDTSLL